MMLFLSGAAGIILGCLIVVFLIPWLIPKIEKFYRQG